MPGRVRKDNFFTRQAAQYAAQMRRTYHHFSQLGKLVGMPQKMIWIGAVMTHQSAQGRTVFTPVMLTQRIRLRLAQLQVFLQIGSHTFVDVRKDVRTCVVQGIVQIKNPQRRAHYLLLMSVPTPSSVRISSNSACRTRPSMICTERTPLRAASSAELIFGNMPPDKVPSATSSSICEGV